MEIAYVAIVVSDSAIVENAFERHLGLAQTEVKFRGERVPAFQVGRTKIVVLTRSSPALDGEAKTGVHHVAIECADPLAAARASGLCRERPAGGRLLR